MENYILHTAIGAVTMCIAITVFFIWVFWKEHRETQNQNAQRWFGPVSKDLTPNEAKAIRKLYKNHLRKYK